MALFIIMDRFTLPVNRWRAFDIAKLLLVLERRNIQLLMRGCSSQSVHGWI
jgi:hypothetical protein